MAKIAYQILHIRTCTITIVYQKMNNRGTVIMKKLFEVLAQVPCPFKAHMVMPESNQLTTEVAACFAPLGYYKRPAGPAPVVTRSLGGLEQEKQVER